MSDCDDRPAVVRLGGTVSSISHEQVSDRESLAVKVALNSVRSVAGVPRLTHHQIDPALHITTEVVVSALEPIFVRSLRRAPALREQDVNPAKNSLSLSGTLPSTVEGCVLP